MQVHPSQTDVISPALQTMSFPTTDVVNRRRIDFGSGNKERAGRKPQFKHDTAIFVRYIDHTITEAKMLDIVKMNAAMNEALEKDSSAVEVTRLVKKSLTEDQIASFKNGVSFRIGCTSSLFEALQTKSNWATHWQIRPWDRDYKNAEKEIGTIETIEIDTDDLNSGETNTTQLNRN